MRLSSQTLTEEIEDASVEDSHFKFGRYLVFTRVYADDDAPAPADAAGPSSSAPPSKKQKADKKPAKAEKKSAAPTIVYVRPEDEFLHHHASWSFTFPIENRPVSTFLSDSCDGFMFIKWVATRWHLCEWWTMATFHCNISSKAIGRYNKWIT